MPGDDSMDQLMTKLESYVDAHPERPWCVHELFEEVGAKHPGEDMLVETQRSLNHLARSKRIASSGMLVERSEGVCDDWFYWSIRSGRRDLGEFGAHYRFPDLSDLIKAHCRHRV